MDDEKIISLFFERDETAIRELGGKYGGLCREISYNILKSRQDTEECVNDAYLKLWSVIPPTHPKSLKAYLCKTVRSLALMRIRHDKAKRRDRDLEVSFSELEEVLAEETVEQGENEALGEIINEFLGELEPDARNIFLRKYWFFDSVKEIAARFGFSESKVKSSLMYSREKLRKMLCRKGVTL